MNSFQLTDFSFQMKRHVVVREMDPDNKRPRPPKQTSNRPINRNRPADFGRRGGREQGRHNNFQPSRDRRRRAPDQLQSRSARDTNRGPNRDTNRGPNRDANRDADRDNNRQALTRRPEAMGRQEAAAGKEREVTVKETVEPTKELEEKTEKTPIEKEESETSGELSDSSSSGSSSSSSGEPSTRRIFIQEQETAEKVAEDSTRNQEQTVTLVKRIDAESDLNPFKTPAKKRGKRLPSWIRKSLSLSNKLVYHLERRDYASLARVINNNHSQLMVARESIEQRWGGGKVESEECDMFDKIDMLEDRVDMFG